MLACNRRPLTLFALVSLFATACESAEPADDAGPTAALPASTAETGPASEGSALGEATGTGSGRRADTASPPAEQPAPSFAPSTLRQEQLRGIALSSLQNGDNDRAIAALISLMETPEMSELKASGMMLLADLYHGEGNSERAVAILQTLIDQAPPMAEFEFLLGRTLGELGRYDEAEPHLRRAIALRPDFLQSYIYLGSLLVAAGKEAEASQVYLDYEQVLAQLIVMAEDPTTPIQERLAVIDALSYANPDERITQLMIRLLAEPSVVINGAAIQTLAEVGDGEAAEALQAYAETAEYTELANAARQAAQRIAARMRAE